MKWMSGGTKQQCDRSSPLTPSQSVSRQPFISSLGEHLLSSNCSAGRERGEGGVRCTPRMYALTVIYRACMRWVHEVARAHGMRVAWQPGGRESAMQDGDDRYEGCYYFHRA